MGWGPFPPPTAAPFEKRRAAPLQFILNWCILEPTGPPAAPDGAAGPHFTEI
ncbi:hypothetical protein HMPREF0262_03214 [Clostridium sp. ATCC 29733]|nr:hypothetical protein HMPREF0262_03214 [Clostridium sp. ATCC 29733]